MAEGPAVSVPVESDSQTRSSMVVKSKAAGAPHARSTWTGADT